jgi:S-DNA-T family DNA segregation ATPase FtsK/SpoIIIE
MKKESKATVQSNELSLKNEIIGILLLFVSIFLIFSVVSHSPFDPSFFHSSLDNNVTNYGGKLGAELSALLVNLFGYASYVIIFFLLFITSYFLINKKIKNILTKSGGYFLFLISFSAFLANVNPDSVVDGSKIKTGGIVGYFINQFFSDKIKASFSMLLFLVLMLIAMILVAKLSMLNLTVFAGAGLVKLYYWSKKIFDAQLERYKKKRRIKKIQDKYAADMDGSKKSRKEKKAAKKKKETAEIVQEPSAKDKKQVVREPSRVPEESLLFADLKEVTAEGGNYQPPPLSYLDAPTKKSQIDFEELEEKKRDLAGRLAEFKISGKIMEYTPGPVITTYEFVPDIGVKVKDVTNLSEDLALVARAQYVRIERILGKKAIGIEIPNKKREIIHLREVLESEEYQKASSPLTIGLGKSKNGEIFISDLREMPHLIVAGATGSGKSVAIHTIILSILYKSSPDEVKLILIDPKRVELAIYGSLPHLLVPVVVDMKLAKNAMDWCVYEMEQRYKKLAALQVRNIEQYNKKLDLLKQAEDEQLETLKDTEKLCYIVIIIDEFADLMMESSREIEESVARIAQKARAVGIHLILATQRPSTDVITGTIKNNFPSRIALAVPSKHDSRTIIDVMGAEKLLGHGDMLFLPPKTASLVRLHCAFVSEEEALRVITYLGKIAKPKFNTQVLKPKTKEGGEGGDQDLDSLFFDAAEVVINTGQASASFLQRRMSIGYARAGRLIDQLEINEVISGSNSRNQREILMSQEELEELKSNMMGLE